MREYTETEKERRVEAWKICAELEDVQNVLIKAHNEAVDALEKVIDKVLASKA